MGIHRPTFTLGVESAPVDSDFPYGPYHHDVTVYCYGWSIAKYHYSEDAYKWGPQHCLNGDDAVENAEKRFVNQILDTIR